MISIVIIINIIIIVLMKTIILSDARVWEGKVAFATHFHAQVYIQWYDDDFFMENKMTMITMTIIRLHPPPSVLFFIPFHLF